MKILFFIFIILSLMQNTDAQESFYPGYIITTENDTILGSIEFKNIESSANVCNFRKSAHEEITSYKPEEIKGYYFKETNKYYISHKIKENRVVFLEYLLQGIVQLYYYQSGGQDYFFIENQEGELTTVTKKPDEMVRNPNTGQLARKENNQYKNVLIQTFHGCHTMMNDIVKMTTIDKSIMVDLVKKYINCKSASEDKDKYVEFGTKYNNPEFKFTFSLYTGVRYQSFNFSEKKEVWSLQDNMNSFYPQIGVDIGLSMPRVLKPVSIQLAVAYSKITGTNESWFILPFRNYRKYTFKSNLIIGNLGIRYTYPKGKIRPIIEFGVCNTYILDYSSEMYNEQDNRSETLKNNLRPYLDVLFSMYGSFGIDFKVRKNSFIFLRSGYDKSWRKGDELSTMQAKLGYTF